MTARKTKKAVWTVALLTVMMAAASAATYVRLPGSTTAAAASRAQTITIYQDNENTAHTRRADDDLAYDYPLPLSHEARSVSIEVRFDLTNPSCRCMIRSSSYAAGRRAYFCMITIQT